MLVLSVVVGRTAALAVSGDAGSGTYGPASGTNTYNATVNNTGTTKQLYDYVQVPSGNSVTGTCSVVSGFPAGSTCTVNGAGAGTAEVNIGSGGLAGGQSGTFSFTTSNSICGSRHAALPAAATCPNLSGAINSTGNSSDYVPITFKAAPPCPTITLDDPTQFRDGIQGTSYLRETRGIHGGKYPYAVSMTGGSVPQGMTLEEVGTKSSFFGLHGTPTENGTFTFTMTATDSTPSPPGPCSASKTYTMVVHCGGITISGLTDPNALGDVGRPLKASPLQATGGTPPYTWEVVVGALEGVRQSVPPGTHLQASSGSDSAKMEGTPTEEGNYQFVVWATDSKGCRGQILVRSISIAPRLELQTSKVGVGLFAESITIVGGSGGGFGSTAASRSTPVPNDLRYRRERIGSNFGGYTTVFSNKSVTSVRVPVSRGYVYCFSAEPQSTKGKGWGTEACKKIPKG